VDSAVIRIRPLTPPPLTVEEEARLRTLVRAAFQWRRKQLRRILRDHPDVARPSEVVEEAARASGVDLEDRPERLSPDQFVRLAGALP
jgi:16S rRNA (adenine1518-N6/adenine1519-N6)-dimethyltransferase